MNEEPKRWWIRNDISQRFANGEKYLIALDYDPKEKDKWIEVQEVPKPKKKKLYAYLAYPSGENFSRRFGYIIYVEKEYRNEPPEYRLPSHDIEVEE